MYIVLSCLTCFVVCMLYIYNRKMFDVSEVFFLSNVVFIYRIDLEIIRLLNQCRSHCDKDTNNNLHDIKSCQYLQLCFLAFDFCRFCVVIRFFHPRHNGQWALTSKDFYTRYYPLHYFLILFLEKEPVFSLFNVEC